MKGKTKKQAPVNACVGKMRYDTASESNKYVRNLNKTQGNRRVKTYYCQVCSGYHYGHDKHTRMKKSPDKHIIPDINMNKIPKKLKGEFYVRKNY